MKVMCDQRSNLCALGESIWAVEAPLTAQVWFLVARGWQVLRGRHLGKKTLLGCEPGQEAEQTGFASGSCLPDAGHWEV